MSRPVTPRRHSSQLPACLLNVDSAYLPRQRRIARLRLTELIELDSLDIKADVPQRLRHIIHTGVKPRATGRPGAFVRIGDRLQRAQMTDHRVDGDLAGKLTGQIGPGGRRGRRRLLWRLQSRLPWHPRRRGRENLSAPYKSGSR